MSDEVRAQVVEFVAGRLRALLLDTGYRYDVIDAVMAVQANNPAKSAHAIKQLSTWVTRPDWSMILPAYARCVRITRDQEKRYEVKPAAFIEDAERTMFTALEKAEAAGRAHGSVDDFLNAFLPMIPAVNKFFDEVLVMAEDKAIQENRLGLVQRISALADGVADMSKLEGF